MELVSWTFTFWLERSCQWRYEWSLTEGRGGWDLVSFHKSVNGPLSLFIPLSDCAMEDIYCKRKKLVQKDGMDSTKKKNPFSSVCVVMPSYLEGFPHAEFVNETASFMLLLPFWFHLISHLNDYSALWSKTAKNTDWSTGLLARPFARGKGND